MHVNLPGNHFFKQQQQCDFVYKDNTKFIQASRYALSKKKSPNTIGLLKKKT